MKNLNILKYLFLSIAITGIQTAMLSQEKTSQVLNNNYFEKLILNTDRELYIAGEKIWFKVNYLESETNNKEILSKIVYLELYNQNTNTVTNGKFRIINGKATGFLRLPKNLSSGNYYLRVYTQFMRNYSSYLYPSVIIKVTNPNKLNTQDVYKPSDAISIVPEGGKLVAEVPSRLAIRINPELQRKLHKSTIIDDDKNVLAQFSTSANGLALIEFTPKNSIKYFLKLSFNDSSSILKPLPPVLKSGMILKSDFSNSRLKISLISNKKLINEANTEYNIEIKSENYEDLLSRSIQPNETIEIWNKLLAKGIVYIILKNKDNEIIDISSIFIPDELTTEIKITKNKDTFKSRELVELNVNLPQSSFKESNYLISVVKVCENNKDSMNLLPPHITYNPVLLPNYLKNHIIKSNSLKRQINIALILYTPIYNTKSFIESLQKNKLNWLPEIRDVSLNGSIIDQNTKEPLNNVMVYAAVFGEQNQLHLYKTKANGEFFFSLNHLNRKQDVFIGTNPLDSVEAKILINNDFSNDYPGSAFIPFFLDSSNNKLIKQIYRNAQVNKAFENKLGKIEENTSYYPLIDEKQEISVLMKDFIHIPVMSEVFDEIVPFVSTRKKKEQYYLNVFNDQTGEMYKDPLVLLDGIPVFDINKIMKIPPEFIHKISVIKTKYYSGAYIINGIIQITTKAKDFAGISFPDESVFIEYQTITKESKPVTPNYKKTDKKDRLPDFRNLLYWNPYLLSTGESNKIKFYTSDDDGLYEITIKGYNQDKQYLGKTFIKVETDIK